MGLTPFENMFDTSSPIIPTLQSELLAELDNQMCSIPLMTAMDPQVYINIP